MLTYHEAIVLDSYLILLQIRKKKDSSETLEYIDYSNIVERITEEGNTSRTTLVAVYFLTIARSEIQMETGNEFLNFKLIKK